MSHIIIAKMGIEGGHCTIYGQQVDGVWSFWHVGSTMDFDDEVGRQWQSEPVANLLDALPQIWWIMHIYHVHPDFEQQLREAFDQHRDHPHWEERRFRPQ